MLLKHTLFVTVVLFVSVNYVFTEESDRKSNYIRAAVVEYNPVYHKESSENTVKANLKNYVNAVETLKKKFNDLRLVVFPEAGLTSVQAEVYNGSALHAEPIPNPHSEELDVDEEDKKKPKVDTVILDTLSKLSHNNKLYIVANMAEKAKKNKTDVMYNTNVVFSPAGKLIARYRKTHIFGEEGKPFSTPEKPELVEFSVDGVKFGTFICFDIIFKTPALDLHTKKGIRHFAFSTAWFSELPHLTAIQEQSAFAYGTNSVLLAAGYNDPAIGSTGSGIYYGKSAKPVAFQAQTKMSFAIVSEIPKTLTDDSISPEHEIVELSKLQKSDHIPLLIEKEDLTVYQTKHLEENSTYHLVQSHKKELGKEAFSVTPINEHICDGDLCCHFSGKMKTIYIEEKLYKNYVKKQGGYNGDEFGRGDYTFAVFNGVRRYATVATGGEQACSIVSCINNKLETCENRTDSDSAKHISVAGDKKEGYFKIGTIFENLQITGNFSTNNTFVTTQLLQSSHTIDKSGPTLAKAKIFGEFVDPALYEIKRKTTKKIHEFTFVAKAPIENPSSLNVYARLYNRDGTQPSSASTANVSTIIFTLSLVISYFLY